MVAAGAQPHLREAGHFCDLGTGQLRHFCGEMGRKCATASFKAEALLRSFGRFCDVAGAIEMFADAEHCLAAPLRKCEVLITNAKINTAVIVRICELLFANAKIVLQFWALL